MTLEDKVADILVNEGLCLPIRGAANAVAKQILQEIFQVYVECPECKGGVAKYTYTDVGGRRGGGVCLKCKGTGKVQAIPDVKGMVELIHLQEKYIKLLGDEINELAGFASTHYWVSTRYKKGKKLREEIQALTTPQGKLYL